MRKLVLLGLLLALAGCSRTFYRNQADRQAGELLGGVRSDPRWSVPDYRVYSDPQSRHYDPANPDCEPMPPDDPTAHKLMERVDGKRGYKRWGKYGCTPTAENPDWMSCLPRDPQGRVLLDRHSVVRLAKLHSREYQYFLEALYLSALDVTFERYRFDTQFFGGSSLFYTTEGKVMAGGAHDQNLAMDSSLEAHRLFASGGELVVGMANSLVWQFSGSDNFNPSTVLDFSLVQPLLRGAGRAVVLERLTESERVLLANVRQMERYRHGFYTEIVAGRVATPGPLRDGVELGTLLAIPSGQGAGFLGLLEEEMQIRNQRLNLVGLHDSVQLLDALFQANKLNNRFQVDLAKQSFLNAESRLLALQTAHQDRLESYLFQLGLPPDLNVRVDDDLLNQFELIDLKLGSLRDRVGNLAQIARDPQQPLTEKHFAVLRQAVEQSGTHLDQVRNDVQWLERSVPQRRANLRRLASRPEVQNGEIDQNLVSVDDFLERVAKCRAEFEELQPQLVTTRDALRAFCDAASNALSQPNGVDQQKLKMQLDEEYLTPFARQLLQLSLIQAAARLDSASLVPVDLKSDEAFGIAGCNRLDWMNARSELVDRWRRIYVVANALKGGVDLMVDGQVGTVGERPLRFSQDNGQLRLGLRFDAPLSRMAERNAYREELIDYQRARRGYYAYVDRIHQVLRAELRSLELSQLNFELRRAAVFVSIMQVDLARLNLERPLRPNETSAVSVTAARDLVTALSSLMDAQNNFLGVWVDYYAQRLNLDFDLGTMRLDPNGEWIDPGVISSRSPEYRGEPEVEELPDVPAVRNTPHRAPPPPPPNPPPNPPRMDRRYRFQEVPSAPPPEAPLQPGRSEAKDTLPSPEELPAMLPVNTNLVRRMKAPAEDAETAVAEAVTPDAEGGVENAGGEPEEQAGSVQASSLASPEPLQ
jgi:hypothetical protein